jgi:hypothetical protein
MNTSKLCSGLALGVCVIQLFSCQKNVKTPEETLSFQTSSEAVIYNEFNDCKLRTITHQHGGSTGSVKGTFVYHPDGLPDNLNYGSQTGTGNPNFYFIYDNQRRLREFRVGYTKNEPGDGGSWHKYGYNNLNQIIVDTIYLPIPPPEGMPDDTKIATITYDNQNRINSETIKRISGQTLQTITYNYDSRGNLIVDGWASSSYDNNVSIFRAHPLFQFIHRNYSKNNAAPQGAYNSNGMPLSSNPSNDIFFNAYPSTVGGTGVTKATYDCDGFNPVNEFLYCKMRSFSFEQGQGTDVPDMTIKATFVYHPDGLPDNLTFNYWTGSNVNHFFIYDNKRRLRELQICSMKNRPDDTGPWHRYGYNNLNQIITDTLLNFTDFDVASGYPRYVSTFTYDNQARIATETIKELGNGNTRTVNYNYDSRGNLILPGYPSSSYDNKVSIYRAHSLFQFIHRNYSKNNAGAKAKYNSKGLPLSNVPGVGGFFGIYPPHGDESGITKINYDCQ